MSTGGPGTSPVSGPSPVAGAQPGAAPDPGALSSFESDLDSSYSGPVAQSEQTAADDSAKALEYSNKEADAAEDYARDLGTADPKMQQWIDSQPTKQAAYATAMHMAPVLSMLVALGGAKTRLTGGNMLAATTGIVQGLNNAADSNYQASYDKWMAGYKELKDQQDRLTKAHELMLDAYKGCADAYQKAAEAARRQTGDLLDDKQKKLAEKVNLFDAQQKSFDQLTRTALALQELNIKKQEEARKQKAQTQADAGNAQDVKAVMAAMVDAGVQLPAGRGGKQLTETITGLIAAHPGDTPQQIAQRVKEGKIDTAAQTKEATTAAAQVGKVSVAENELLNMGPKALAASTTVPRTQWVPVNQMLQKGQAANSDPNLKEFAQRTNAILNAYDVLGARGGSDVAKRAENRQNLLTADSPEAYKRAIDVMQDEARIAKASGRQAEDDAATGADRGTSPSAKTVVQTGTTSDGRKVVKYSDGSIAYAQ